MADTVTIDTATFHYRPIRQDGTARLGEISTPRGIIRTPAFMPVGTVATVKALYPEQVKEAGADILLGNTYHLMLRPGAERVAKLGGLHKFMRWDGPILTDSGGFQVMSLSKIRKITEEGVTFQSHLDGSQAHAVARALDRDPVPARRRHPDAVRRVHRAAGRAARGRARHGAVAALGRALEARLRQSTREWRCRSWSGAVRHRAGRYGCRPQAAFGGSACQAMDLPGYAVGGLAVGEGHDLMLATLEATLPFLPTDKPRYLMGVGTPLDLIESVRRGIDMFDCVLPTRNGRHGLAYTWNGPVNLRNAVPRRRSGSARPRKLVPGGARLLARLPASSHSLGRISRRHAAVVDQHGFLSGPDGGHACRHRRGPLRRLGRGDQGRVSQRTPSRTSVDE